MTFNITFTNTSHSALSKELQLSRSWPEMQELQTLFFFFAPKQKHSGLSSHNKCEKNLYFVQNWPWCGSYFPVYRDIQTQTRFLTGKRKMLLLKYIPIYFKSKVSEKSDIFAVFP